MKENKFYKQAWFYILLVGILVSAVAVLGSLYTDAFNTNTAFAFLAGGIFLTVLGGVFSFFSFQPIEPTLKTFSGRDLGIKMEDIGELNERELDVVFSLVTGTPLTEIQEASFTQDPEAYKRALRSRQNLQVKEQKDAAKQAKQAAKDPEKDFQAFYKQLRQQAERELQQKKK